METLAIGFNVQGRVAIMADKSVILVIDDEPSVADALEIILCDSGYDVVVARTGSEGLEQAEMRHFDLVITDLRLPDMTGLTVLDRLVTRDRESRVIVITAHSTPEIVAESIRLGALNVLAKPFYPSEVLGLIRTALDKERSLQ